jgi:hypothetical protein
MSARLVLVQIVLGVVLGVGSCRSEGEPATAGGNALAPPAAPAKETGMRTYTMEYFAKPDLPRVTVTAEIPAAWTESLSARGAPSFTIAGKTGSPPTITAIGIDQPDVQARLERAMELQYGAGTPGVIRTPLDGGRVWAVRKEANVVHARMFIPAPHGIVMAVAILKHQESARLAELEAIYRTVRVQGAR